MVTHGEHASLYLYTHRIEFYRNGKQNNWKTHRDEPPRQFPLSHCHNLRLIWVLHGFRFLLLAFYILEMLIYLVIICNYGGMTLYRQLRRGFSPHSNRYATHMLQSILFGSLVCSHLVCMCVCVLLIHGDQ